MNIKGQIEVNFNPLSKHGRVWQGHESVAAAQLVSQNNRLCHPSVLIIIE